MIVVLGSTNPTKLQAVKNTFTKHFKDVKVIQISTESGVADQPLTETETFQGALNRARNSLKSVKNADFGIGIEGGLDQKSFGWFEQSIIVIINRQGLTGVGSTGGLVLPKKFIKEIKKGKNLEEVIDRHFQTHKVGRGIGMFGIMTKRLVTRTSGMEQGIAFALAPFLHPNLYP